MRGVALEQGDGVDYEDIVGLVAVSAGAEEGLEMGLVQPEEDAGVERVEPVLQGHVGEATLQWPLAQGDLVADDGEAVLGVMERDAGGSAPAQDVRSRWVLHFEEVDEGACGEQAVALDALPRAELGHVVEARVLTDDLGGLHAGYQARRSMTLRTWKRVEINDTGAPATRSTSSMKRIVSGCSWSKRRALRFSTSR